MPRNDSKLVRLSLIALFALLLVYALYEGWGMLYGPVITIPEERITVNNAYILIKGDTERITELRLNGAAIPVTEDGAFETPHLLAPGSNRIILEARDARGRTTEKTLDILYIPHEAPVVAPPPAASTTTAGES